MGVWASCFWNWAIENEKESKKPKITTKTIVFETAVRSVGDITGGAGQYENNLGGVRVGTGVHIK